MVNSFLVFVIGFIFVAIYGLIFGEFSPEEFLMVSILLFYVIVFLVIASLMKVPSMF